MVKDKERQREEKERNLMGLEDTDISSESSESLSELFEEENSEKEADY